jgi:hypothetical protein
MDVVNLKKLYSLLETLTDEQEKEIIYSLIEKRNKDINFKTTDLDFKDKDLYRYYDSVRKIYINACNYCLDVFDINTETEYFYNNFENKIHNLMYKYQVINCKINKQKDHLLRKVSRESSDIELFKNIIKILKEYETSKQ